LVSDAAIRTSTPLHSTSSAASTLNDIGIVIKEGMSVEEVSHAVSALTPGEKYILLTKHFKPDRRFLFLKVYSKGCNRSFQFSWFDKYP